MAKPTAPRASVIHVCIAVWGTEFIELFLDVTVPNQLTPGNLGALPPGSRYRLFTRAEDVAVLEESAVIRRAGEMLPVDVVAVRELSSAGNRYQQMTACHCKAAVDANAAGAALVFLSPDHFLAEGVLAALVARHAAGARAVVSPALRLDKESFLTALDAGGTVRSLAARPLVDLALRHLHPFTKQHFVDASPFGLFPTAVYWRADGGLIARSFHQHPLLVDPVRRDVVPKGTIDGGYVARCCPRIDDIHVVTDSDELVLFELSPGGRRIGGASRAGLPLLRAAAVTSRCDAHQMAYWERAARLHSAEIDHTWEPVEQASAAFASRVVRLRPFGQELFRVFRGAERLRQLGDRYKQAWRRRGPRLRTKRLSRPLSLATHRVSKAIRKTTKPWLRGVQRAWGGR